MTRGEDVSEVGRRLLAAADATARSPGEVVGQLFPYIWHASRRMSTRAISDWLKKNYGVQISQPTISRALRSPEKYWRAFAEFIEPEARCVERHVDVMMQDFLFNEALFKHALDEKLSLSGRTRKVLEEQTSELAEAASFLERTWFSLSHASRLECRPYLEDEPDEQTKS